MVIGKLTICMEIMFITGEGVFFFSFSQHANNRINHCLIFTFNYHVHSECLPAVIFNYLAWRLLHSGALDALLGMELMFLDMSNVIVLPFLSV